MQFYIGKLHIIFALCPLLIELEYRDDSKQSTLFLGLVNQGHMNFDCIPSSFFALAQKRCIFANAVLDYLTQRHAVLIISLTKISLL